MVGEKVVQGNPKTDLGLLCRAWLTTHVIFSIQIMHGTIGYIQIVHGIGFFKLLIVILEEQ